MTVISPTPALLVEQHGAVAQVSFNRPDQINAFNEDIRQSFPQLLAAIERDSEIRAVVLCGAGERGFCAGADIKEGRQIGSLISERRRFMPHSWIEALDQVSKPVIAAIHGICFGGGMEIALACDIRIASRDACFGLTETALGLIPGGGGTQRLLRLIGLGPALDLLLSAEKIPAEEAHRLGIVTRLAEDHDDVIAKALALAATIAARPPAAVAYCKEAAIGGAHLDLASGLRLEKSLFTLLMGTSDRAEAAAAFREKRNPNFTGN